MRSPTRTHRIVILLFWITVSTALHGQQLSETTVNFGGWPVGVTSVQHELAFKNAGTSVLAIGLTLSSGPFAIPVNKCGRGVKPGTHCNIWLTYTPKVLGEQDNGTVTFTYTGSGVNGSVSAALAGYGSGPFVTSTSMGFGPSGNVFNFFTTTYSTYQIPIGETILNTCTNEAGSVISYTAQISSYGRCHKGGCAGPWRAYANWSQPIQEFEYGSWSCQGEYVGDQEFAPSSGYANIVEDQGQPISVLYNFTDGNDGGAPMSNLVSDSAGNLYGTTTGGGANGQGIVYEISPNGSGGWTETVLYSFTGGTDGGIPSGSLAIDSIGNIYGTTESPGVVFELSRAGPSWTETVLISAASGYSIPNGLIMDTAGNLYGENGEGVFEISLSSGSWKEQTIYTGGIVGGLAIDHSSNLFFVGPQERRTGGTVVELSPNESGSWTSTVIYTFKRDVSGHGADGTLVTDKLGNVYGITDAGYPKAGTSTATVYRLELSKESKWTLKNLYVLNGVLGSPFTGVAVDSDENVYVIGVGTNSDGYGAIFELPAPGYTEGNVWNFDGPHGRQPNTGLIFDNAGNPYGTTYSDGSGGYGVVFELIP